MKSVRKEGRIYALIVMSGELYCSLVMLEKEKP